MADNSADQDGNGDYEPQTCIPCPPQDIERGALIAVLHNHDCGEQHDGGPYHETSVKCPPGSARQRTGTRKLLFSSERPIRWFAIED
ncbi:MAG TPA: hypothetical protein VM282_13150 [Acidimicrobiales bacterium]|nr:hypothetical protein [Acidimicrobiales bacterium]